MRAPEKEKADEPRPSASSNASEISLELADAALHQPAFHGKRGIEARDRLADDPVVGGERLGRNALVPDLADAGAAPLDQMEGGLGGAGHGKGRGRDAGSR